MDNLYELGEDRDSKLEEAVRVFEEERREAWSEEAGKETDFLFLADGVGNQILRASEFLLEPTPNEDFPASWEGADVIADHPTFATEVTERVQIAMARRLSLDTSEKAKRCRQLTGLLGRGQPSKPVLWYINRVARSYIAGFYPEAIILCRPVVESAVERAAKRGGIRPKVKVGRSKFKARVDALVSGGRISHEVADGAKEIWRKASRLAHGRDDPGSVHESEAYGVIAQAMSTVRGTFGR